MRGLRFGAQASLFVLFAINLANYMDRYLVVALQEPIKETFRVTDSEIGYLTSAFVFVYMVASPLCGYLADRVQRRYVVAGAVALWSVATALASRAATFRQLLALRGTVGIGESGYNAAGQALLTDLFPDEKRNRVMAIFNLAIPVGSALGFVAAAQLLQHLHDWRAACLVAGAPGVLLAFLALGLPRGSEITGANGKEDPQPETADAGKKPEEGGTLAAYWALLRDAVFMANTFGFAMQSFALGALVSWAAAFLHRQHAMPIETAASWSGAIAAGSGLVGTALGAVLADAFAKRARIPAYALVTGAGYLISAPLLAVGLFLPTGPALACMFFAMVAAFLGIGPQNAIVAARAPALHRATAFALVVFILHLFGDAASPPILGALSDRFRENGMPEGAALQQALLLAPIALVLGAIFMFGCAWASRGKGAASAP